MRWRQMGPADDRPSRGEDVVIVRQIQDVQRRYAAAREAGDKAEINRLNIVRAEVEYRGREAWTAGRAALGMTFKAG